MKTAIHTNINNIAILDSHMKFRNKKFRLMIEFNVEKTYGEDRSRTVNDYYIEPGYLAPDLSMISYTLSFQNLVIAFILFIFAEVFERRRLVLAFSHFRNNCQ